jgi:hypothetical protein
MAKRNLNAVAAAPARHHLGLVTETAALRKYVADTHKMGAKYHTQLHIAAVSVMLHVAEHGQVAVLNEFYDGLSKAYQSGFKRWASVYAGDMPAPVGLGVGKGWLKMEKNQFAVINDRMDSRVKADDSFVNTVEAVFKAKPFFDKTLDNGIGNAFGPEQVLGRLTSLLSTMQKADNVGAIPPEMLAAVQQAVMQVDALVPAPVIQ